MESEIALSNNGAGPAEVVYDLDPATEQAAREWPMALTPYRRDDEQGTYVLAITCGRCGGALMGNVQAINTPDVLPLVRLHLIRSHGYPANPVRQ